MPISPNPLQEMSGAVGSLDQHHERPDHTFVKTALPGFKQALNSRRSIREYDAESIPEETLRDCLRDATLAPSSSNLQVYELYWIRNAEKKVQVAQACLEQPAAMTAGELIVVVARGDKWKSNLEKLVKLMTDDGKKPLEGPLKEYYNKIVPMLLRTDPFGINNLVRRIMYWYKGRHEPFMRTPVNRGDHRIYAHVQASLAAQTLMLSIAAHGYESCPIGGMDKNRIAQLLHLPSAAEVSLVVAAGRGLPEGLYGPRVRLEINDLVKEVF